MFKYNINDILVLKSEPDGGRWTITGFKDNLYCLNINGINTTTNKDFAEREMKVQATKIDFEYAHSKMELLEPEIKDTLYPQMESFNPCVEHSLSTRDVIQPPAEYKATIKNTEPVIEENFEQEYSKRAIKLAIKNNKVQNLLKKTEQNKQELAALQSGQWFNIYGRYDMGRIFWVGFFSLAALLIPGYLAFTLTPKAAILSPLFLSVIWGIVWAARDKALDAYIAKGPAENPL